MGNIYLIKMKSDKEIFFKIGVTIARYGRFYRLMKMGYEVEIIYMVLGVNCLEAYFAERNLHRLFDSYEPLNKFGGHSECFSSVDINFYKERLSQLITSHTEIIENMEISWRKPSYEYFPR